MSDRNLLAEADIFLGVSGSANVSPAAKLLALGECRLAVDAAKVALEQIERLLVAREAEAVRVAGGAL